MNRICTLASVTITAAAALLLSSCSVSEPAGEQPSSESKRVALFDGKTLDGWTVITCEATIDNGELLITAGNGLIQTEKKYGDFVLEYEWKALKEDNWDSGALYKMHDTLNKKLATFSGRDALNKQQRDTKQSLEQAAATSEALIRASKGTEGNRAGKESQLRR